MVVVTLPETNIAPENGPSQKEISSSNHTFSGAMLVSGRVIVCCSFIHNTHLKGTGGVFFSMLFGRFPVLFGRSSNLLTFCEILVG